MKTIRGSITDKKNPVAYLGLHMYLELYVDEQDHTLGADNILSNTKTWPTSPCPNNKNNSLVHPLSLTSNESTKTQMTNHVNQIIQIISSSWQEHTHILFLTLQLTRVGVSK